MRLSLGMKVGLVSLFSCPALVLSLLFSMGLTSAHTTTSLQSAHISSMALADHQRGNFEHEGISDPSNDSSTTGCPEGTVRTVTFDGGAGPQVSCTDPGHDPSIFSYPDWKFRQTRPKD